MVGLRRVAHALVQLLARGLRVALLDELLREQGAYAVHLRVVFEHAAQHSHGLVHVPAPTQHDGLEGF